MSVKQFQYAITLLPYCEETTDERLATMSKPELSAWITATVTRRDEMRRSRNDQAVSEIKGLSLLDYVERDLDFRKTGIGTHQALCPFHEEKTPSFTITETTNLYHCFGCKAGGDIFSYVQERDGVGFVDALKILADYARIDLGDDGDISHIERKPRAKTPNQKPEIERPAVSELLEAVDGSCQQLEEKRGAQAYLKKRGLTMETARSNRVGYMWLGGFGAISFPLFLNGELTSYNRRIYNDLEGVYPKTMLKKKAKTGLFLTSDYPDASTLLVIEGEINALSAWQIGREYINVIGVSGKEYFKSLADEIHQRAKSHGYTHVIFWADLDKDERNIALESRNRAIYELNAEISSVTFRDVDANDLLLSGELDAMLDRIAPPTPLLSPNRDLEAWGNAFGASTITELLPVKPLGTPIVQAMPPGGTSEEQEEQKIETTGEFPSATPQTEDREAVITDVSAKFGQLYETARHTDKRRVLRAYLKFEDAVIDGLPASRLDDIYQRAWMATQSVGSVEGHFFHEWVFAMRAVRAGDHGYLRIAQDYALAIPDPDLRDRCLAETTLKTHITYTMHTQAVQAALEVA